MKIWYRIPTDPSELYRYRMGLLEEETLSLDVVSVRLPSIEGWISWRSFPTKYHITNLDSGRRSIHFTVTQSRGELHWC